MPASIIRRLNVLGEDIANGPPTLTRAQGTRIVNIMTRIVLTLASRGAQVTDDETGETIVSIGDAEFLDMLLGDELSIHRHSVLREMTDRGWEAKYTGRHDRDGSGRALLARNVPLRERGELPPPPPPREE